MSKIKTLSISLDKDGHFILPVDVLLEYGILPGDSARLNLTGNGIEISRSAGTLAKVYIEPTNACNLDCRTCMRNVWQEPPGFMATDTYGKIIESIQAMNQTPLIFLGGIGEPLAHPKIREMATTAKKLGAEVELITNGILLDEKTVKWMMEIGLDRVWVSIDGARPESYADVRLGDALPRVISNLKRLKTLQAISPRLGVLLPKLGIAFVAMKQNFQDLTEVIKLGKRLGADRFSISNVLPYSKGLQDQVLYSRSMYMSDFQPSDHSPVISIPRFDLDETALKVLSEIYSDHNILQHAGKNLEINMNTCPFVTKGSLSIRWDGEVSPCLPLMHAHTSYLDDTLRFTRAVSFGNVNEKSLLEIWNQTNYQDLRTRLLTFDFSPCTVCNSCEMAESNQEDCFGNIQPTCGGCLWAQGFIQCP